MKPARFYCGVFLVTASGLMLQIVQTRILSVVLWYYLAFLVISIAMFGITAGTVRLSIGLENSADLIDDLDRALNLASKAAATRS